MLYRLKEAGYQAFLVGGAVRDLLLGITPKDFDVATNALPEEVRRLFRNCRLIGRRFRLAHVHFGNEIIEVATFRAAAAPEREDGEDGAEGEAGDRRQPVDGHRAPRRRHDRGRILRDNMYGTIDEDVWRRDFTANALYYNVEDFSVWDFVGGVADVRARRLKLIGDPEARYREDPVRMLRAVRFAAKLDFCIEPSTEEPIRRLAQLLDGVPPARLFDETLKLFLAGFGAKSYRLLRAVRTVRASVSALGRRLCAAALCLRRADAGTRPRQHRCAHRRGQAGDADLPVRAAAVGRGAARDERAAGAGRRRISRSCCRPATPCSRRSSRASRFRAASRCRCASC